MFTHSGRDVLRLNLLQPGLPRGMTEEEIEARKKEIEEEGGSNVHAVDSTHWLRRIEMDWALHTQVLSGLYFSMMRSLLHSMGHVV